MGPHVGDSLNKKREPVSTERTWGSRDFNNYPEKFEKNWEKAELSTELDKDGDEGQRVGLCYQLMLLSGLASIEMSTAFCMMYAYLLMQFLGVPTSLMTIDGVISGPFTTVFLLLTGYFTDKGGNVKLRKFVILASGTLVFLTGHSSLLAACIMKIDSESRYLNILYAENETIPIIASEHLVEDITPQSNDSNLVIYLGLFGLIGMDISYFVSISAIRAFILDTVPKFQHAEVLGMATIVQAGAATLFCVIGCFNLSDFFGNAFHTDGTAAVVIFFLSILLLASVIGFICTIVALTVLKKKKVPEAQTYEVNAMTKKTHDTANHEILSVPVHGQATDTDYVDPPLNLPVNVMPMPHCSTHDPSKQSLLFHNVDDDSASRPLLTGNAPNIAYCSMNSLSTQNENVKHSETEEITQNILNNGIEKSCAQDSISTQDTAEHQITVLQYIPEGHTLSSFTEPISTSEEKTESLEDTIPSSDIVGAIVRRLSSTAIIQQLEEQQQIFLEHQKQKKKLKHRSAVIKTIQCKAEQAFSLPDYTRCLVEDHLGKKFQFKARLVVLCVSSFFAIGASLIFNLFSTNSLTIGILDGDPDALPGTPARDNYDSGFQIGAIGGVINYVMFTAFSLASPKLFHILGEKGQWVFLHMCLMVGLVAVLLEPTVEVYFVFMVLGGAYRCCMMTFPFILVQKYTREWMEIESEVPRNNGPSYAGRLVNIIGFLIPAHYGVLSVIMGPLIDVTGNVWVAQIYGLCSATLSLVISSLLFFI